MYLAVAAVRPTDGYRLHIVFEDGSEAVLDMTPYLDFGVFHRLKDLDQFRRVRVAFDSIEWDCGVDLDPEFISARARSREPV